MRRIRAAEFVRRVMFRANPVVVPRPARTPTGMRLTGWLVRHDLPWLPAQRKASVDFTVDLFFELVDALGVRTFVEAGAKEGSASRRGLELPGVERAIAFEANPYTHRRFAKRLKKAGVDYRHRALSAETGDIEFFVRISGSTGAPMADGQASMLVRPDHEPGYEVVSVPASRLDEVLERVDAPFAMWVDVEGASDEVFHGAAGILDAFDALIVETEDRIVWEGQRWRSPELVDHLVRQGFVPVARDRQSRFQYNIVFVRRSRLTPEVQAIIRSARERSGVVLEATATPVG